MHLPRKHLNTGYPYLYLFIIGVLMSGCSFFGTTRNDRGEFTASSIRNPWLMEAPERMVLVPGGSFMTGEVSEDIFGRVNPNRRVTVSSFFMDEGEVTNNTYRRFIEILLEKVGETGAGQEGDTEEGDDEEGDEQAQEDDQQESGQQQKDPYELELNSEFIMTKLYPDTNVFRNDFSNNMADILLEGYFEHPAYDDYPVVGVSWEAARRFAAWRSKYLNEYRESQGLPPYPSFSLPSAAQWSYAARGGNELAKYPWGGPYIRDYEGDLRANFKSGKGNYNESGYTYTSPVDAFPPNDFGLYDMAGNVSEWTLDAYKAAAVYLVWDLDPLYVDDNQPMKVIKGGSWKDIARFLETGISDYEHKDSARSYIGFRCVMPYIGAQVSENY